MRILSRLFLTMALTGLASAASGASLTAVVAAPNPANTNAVVVVTATKGGATNCGWRVDYGDGTPNSPKMGFPGNAGATKSAPEHTYAQAGTYTVVAFGVDHGSRPKCTGSVQTQLVVKASGGGGAVLVPDSVKDQVLKPKKPGMAISELCASAGCRGLSVIRSVKKHFGFTRPGGVVGWVGHGFESGGSVKLTYVDWQNNTKTRDLEVIEWKPGMVGTIIPQNLKGFRQQTASIVVKASSGFTTPAYAFTLYPTLEQVALQRQHVKIVHCSDEGNMNACNMQDYAGNPPIPGFHKNKIGAIGDDQGTDKYEIKVKNGWAISWTKTNKWGTSSNEWVQGPNDGAGVGLSTWTPQYTWHVSPADNVYYATWITVEGPSGVPFQ